MNLREMTGLEVFQAMRDGKLPHPTMADTDGTLFAHATATCAIVRPQSA